MLREKTTTFPGQECWGTFGGGAILIGWISYYDLRFPRKTRELEREEGESAGIDTEYCRCGLGQDVHGVFLTCNHRFEQLCGAPVSEIVDKTDDDFLSPEMAKMFRENDRLVLESGQPISKEWLNFAEGGASRFV